MAYDNQCGSCLEFKDKRNCSKEYDSSYYEKGYCDYYKCFYYPDDSCSHHKNKKTYVSSCFITTVVSSILGYDDRFEDLETLRLFRNNVMQKDESYRDLLYTYDTIGPVIAERIMDDYKETKDISVASNLYRKFIEPTTKFINENNYDKAVMTYKNMTDLLIDYYNINEELKIDNYDYSRGGHGKVKILGN